MIDKDKHDNDKQDKVWQEGYKTGIRMKSGCLR